MKDQLKAGIQPKDVVTKANGKIVEGKPLDQVVKLVSEVVKVTLTIKRGSQRKTLRLNVTIHVKSVEYEKKATLVSLLLINSKVIHRNQNLQLLAHKTRCT